MLLRSSWRRRPPAAQDAAAGIAVSCRVRLARNLRDERFPDWADEAGRRRVFEALGPWLAHDAGIEGARRLDVGALDDATRDLLCERHLISTDLAGRGAGVGLVVAGDERLAVMLNEEDHLRIQVIEPGMDLQHAWRVADALDTRLDARFACAFSPRLGYLTACPSNVGTGLRASIMVHLLGLHLAEDLDASLRALERLRFAVRGVTGEGSEAAGHMFQVSNQETLGADEATLIGELLDIVGEVVRQERNARLRLRRDSPEVLVDCVARALAVIQSARIMATGEALDHLSALRLGVHLGLVRRLTVAEVDDLTLAIQPGHLQKRLGQTLEPARRDVVRADFMRAALAQAELHGAEARTR